MYQMKYLSHSECTREDGSVFIFIIIIILLSSASAQGHSLNPLCGLRIECNVV